MRRKLSPRPLETAQTRRAPAAAAGAPLRGYQTILARARALGLFSAIAIAPLGALAGSVAACGGAAPVQAYPREAASGEKPPPVTTVAPPPAAPPDGTPPSQ